MLRSNKPFFVYLKITTVHLPSRSERVLQKTKQTNAQHFPRRRLLLWYLLGCSALPRGRLLLWYLIGCSALPRGETPILVSLRVFSTPPGGDTWLWYLLGCSTSKGPQQQPLRDFEGRWAKINNILQEQEPITWQEIKCYFRIVTSQGFFSKLPTSTPMILCPPLPHPQSPSLVNHYTFILTRATGDVVALAHFRNHLVQAFDVKNHMITINISYGV